MQIFLHEDVAAARECRVLFTDYNRVDGRLPARILGTVHKADQIAVVEIAEGLHFVHWRDSVSKARHQLRC